MTILIVSYTPKEILFASDTYRYFLKEGTVEDVLSHKLQIRHDNYKEYIESYETNNPKVHKITKNIGIASGGDGRFNDITQDLNTRKNIPKQILERLKRKKKLPAFWCCHVGRFNKHKNKAEFTSIIYENGEITIRQSDKDNIEFSAFSPEMKDIFFLKYVMTFYLSDTQEKINVLKQFFNEITQLYNNQAGGTPIIAKIDEEGFKWLS